MFKIYHINIRSLNKNFSSLYAFIAINNPDIVCMSEIWQVNDKSNVHIEGYRLDFVTRNDRRGGGVGIYVRDTIVYSLIKHSNFEIENIFIKFHAHNKKCIVGCIYRPPNSDFDHFIENISKFLKNISIKKANAFILGDFNVDFNESSPKQIQLLNIFSELCLNQVINEPTRVTDKSSTTIDLIFTNTQHQTYNSLVIKENITDHYITGIEIDLKPRKAARTIRYRPLHQLNREVFATQLSNHVALTNNLCFDTFHNIFIEILDKNCPYILSKSKRPFAPWIYEEEIQNLIKSGKSLQKKYKINPDSSEAKTAFRLNQKNIQKLITFHQKNYIQKVMNNEDVKTLWQTIRRLMHHDSSSINIDSNTFNKFYAENASNLTRHSPTTTNIIFDFIQSSHESQTSFYFQTITLSDIEKEILLLKNYKVDFHGISSSLIKNFSSILSPVLLDFINASIQNSFYPNSLKNSQLIPLPKLNSKSSNPKDYRPIAIQPTFSKIYEKIILRQIISYLEAKNLISDSQYGFRQGKSTEQLLHKLYNKICLNLDNGMLTIIISLDMSKAFDTLDHFKLIQKLDKISFSKSAKTFILSYLRDRTSTTSCNNSFSSPLIISAGVPQGSILGPVLFNIYINDFITSFTEATVFQYADDCQIVLSFTKDQTFPHVISKIENIILIAEKWCHDNFLCLNKTKTQILPIFNKNTVFSRMPFFTSTTSSNPLPSSVTLSSSSSPHTTSNSSFINFIPHCKILGIYFNNKLSWCDHFYHQNKIMQKSFYSFKMFFNRYTCKKDSYLRFNILSKTILPKMTYCISLFHTHNTICNKIWLYWNRRLCSLTLCKFARTEDTLALKLLSLPQWIRIRLILLAHSGLTQRNNFLEIKQNSRPITLRSTASILPYGSHKSTTYQLALAWNSLSNEERLKFLQKKKLTFKDVKCLILC